VERLFTVAEANQLIPALRELLERLRAARAALTDQSQRATRRAASNGSALAATAGSSAEDAFNALLGEIEALGVTVRDAESGLVDFAATREGEPIYLCWRPDEAEVSFWHPRDTGFAGRQPL